MKKILIMEDNLITRLKLKEVLEQFGFAVHTAREGYKAVKMFETAYKSKKPFDVVILDLIVNNGLNGSETLDLIRKIDDNVKFIVSSGYISSSFINDQKKNNIEILSKPYKIKHLYYLLNGISTY